MDLSVKPSKRILSSASEELLRGGHENETTSVRRVETLKTKQDKTKKSHPLGSVNKRNERLRKKLLPKKTPIQPSINRRRRRRRSMPIDRRSIYSRYRSPSPSRGQNSDQFHVKRSRRSTPDGRRKMSRCEIRRHAPDQLAQKDFLVRVERLRIESNKIFVSHPSSILLAFHVASPSRRASSARRDRRRLHAIFRQSSRQKKRIAKKPTTRCARTRDVASTGTNRYKHIRTLIISDKSWLISAWNANVSVSSLIVCFTSLASATPFDATSVSGCGFFAFPEVRVCGCFWSQDSSNVCFFETSFDSVRFIPMVCVLCAISSCSCV